MNLELGWPIVISSLVFLSYGAWSIAREKDLYTKTAIPMNLGEFKFLIPAWWSNSIDLVNASTLTTDRFIYYRSDTHYDWRCGIGNLTEAFISTSQHCDQLIQNLGLVFDEDALRELPWRNLANNFDCTRIEGTATRGDEDRVYADILVIKNISTAETIYLWSISSILNGCVEGPYVEEVLKRLEYQNQLLETAPLS